MHSPEMAGLLSDAILSDSSQGRTPDNKSITSVLGPDDEPAEEYAVQIDHYGRSTPDTDWLPSIVAAFDNDHLNNHAVRYIRKTGWAFRNEARANTLVGWSSTEPERKGFVPQRKLGRRFFFISHGNTSGAAEPSGPAIVHLSLADQQLFNEALRKSTRIVHKATL